MFYSTTAPHPAHERACCSPRSHVALFLELVAVARHDADVKRLLPEARKLLFGTEAARWAL